MLQDQTPRIDRSLSVAPMMDWTDRHCRVFHRCLSRHTLLYTEMIVAAAIVRGNAERLLRYSAEEHPVALQIGGSNPVELARAVEIAAPYDYDEINLNVGCPSDRVQSGTFGAVLMRDADLVARCTGAMVEASARVGGPEITVKCRIGVDEQTPAEILPSFIETVARSGVRSFAVHARKAWLQGLSPKENRTIPPLDYDLVREIKRARPDLEIVLNGGLESLDAAIAEAADLDGAMIGRAAYHTPFDILGNADARIFGKAVPHADPRDVVARMAVYADAQAREGVPLKSISRHMLGLFAGRPGARAWRRTLSEGAPLTGATSALLAQALAAVERAHTAISDAV